MIDRDLADYNPPPNPPAGSAVEPESPPAPTLLLIGRGGLLGGEKTLDPSAENLRTNNRKKKNCRRSIAQELGYVLHGYIVRMTECLERNRCGRNESRCDGVDNIMRVQNSHERLEINNTFRKFRTMDGWWRDSANEAKGSSSIRLQDAKPSDNIPYLRRQCESACQLPGQL